MIKMKNKIIWALVMILVVLGSVNLISAYIPSEITWEGINFEYDVNLKVYTSSGLDVFSMVIYPFQIQEGGIFSSLDFSPYVIRGIEYGTGYLLTDDSFIDAYFLPLDPINNQNVDLNLGTYYNVESLKEDGVSYSDQVILAQNGFNYETIRPLIDSFTAEELIQLQNKGYSGSDLNLLLTRGATPNNIFDNVNQGKSVEDYALELYNNNVQNIAEDLGILQSSEKETIIDQLSGQLEIAGLEAEEFLNYLIETGRPYSVEIYFAYKRAEVVSQHNLNQQSSQETWLQTLRDELGLTLEQAQEFYEEVMSPVFSNSAMGSTNSFTPESNPELQNALREILGDDYIEGDDISNVLKFQANYNEEFGLDIDGIVGSETRGVLNHLLEQNGQEAMQIGDEYYNSGQTTQSTIDPAPTEESFEQYGPLTYIGDGDYYKYGEQMVYVENVDINAQGRMIWEDAAGQQHYYYPEGYFYETSIGGGYGILEGKDLIVTTNEYGALGYSFLAEDPSTRFIGVTPIGGEFQGQNLMMEFTLDEDTGFFTSGAFMGNPDYLMGQEGTLYLEPNEGGVRLSQNGNSVTDGEKVYTKNEDGEYVSEDGYYKLDPDTGEVDPTYADFQYSLFKDGMGLLKLGTAMSNVFGLKWNDDALSEEILNEFWGTQAGWEATFCKKWSDGTNWPANFASGNGDWPNVHIEGEKIKYLYINESKDPEEIGTEYPYIDLYKISFEVNPKKELTDDDYVSFHVEVRKGSQKHTIILNSEVEDGDYVRIETDSAAYSRKGPNQIIRIETMEHWDEEWEMICLVFENDFKYPYTKQIKNKEFCNALTEKQDDFPDYPEGGWIGDIFGVGGSSGGSSSGGGSSGPEEEGENRPPP